MRRAAWWLGLVALGWLPATGWAQAHPSYARAVQRVEQLYLRRAEVEPRALLEASADLLVDRIGWLFADVDGASVTLRHADGEVLVTATAESWDALPGALASFEDALRSTRHDTGDVDLRLTVLSGAMLALDRFSRVLSGEGLQSFDTRLQGTLVGIGATLRIVDGHLKVISVLPDGPAEKGGLLPDDVIERVDDVSTLNMSVRESVRRIRGPLGSTVTLYLRRGPIEAPERLTLALQRDKVILPNVEHAVLDGGVAYVRIDSVSRKTVHNLGLALDALRAEGALDRGVVLDLRGNTGGSMKESAGAVDAFVESGLVLTTVGPDGQPVAGLLSQLQTTDDGNEPVGPVVVLTDDRTASGAEIISGSLLQLERAVLVGRRTYGKGEVQKIYGLDDDARLKLTVAEYLVGGTMHVAGVGIQPDLTLGRVVLDEQGARLVDFDTEREQRAWSEILPVLDEGRGWREGDQPAGGDVTKELARRTVLAAASGARSDVLAALASVAAQVRQEQDALLVQALSAGDVDWSAAPEDGSAPETRVTMAVQADPDDAESQQLIVTLHNDGPSTLYRTVVDLRCEGFRAWDGLALPFGRVPRGGSVTRTLQLRLRPGIDRRADAVTGWVRGHRRPEAALAPMVVEVGTTPPPRVAVKARLEGDGPVRVAVLTVHNLSSAPLLGVELSFRFPEVAGVELITEAARVPMVPPGGTGEARLELQVADEAPDWIPLSLEVDTDDLGRLAVWPIELHRRGQESTWEAPVVQTRRRPLTAAPGRLVVPLTVSDDHGLASVTVFANDEKVVYLAGDGTSLKVQASFDVQPGDNLLRVVAVDDRGLRTVESWHVLGVTAP